MRELRLHPDAALAAGRHRPLLVQRLRPLQQDERPQPAPHQAAEARGECERRPPLRPGPERRFSCGRGAAGSPRAPPRQQVRRGPGPPGSARERGPSCPLHTRERPSGGCPEETSVWGTKTAFPHIYTQGMMSINGGGRRCRALYHFLNIQKC